MIESKILADCRRVAEAMRSSVQLEQRDDRWEVYWQHGDAFISKPIRGATPVDALKKALAYIVESARKVAESEREQAGYHTRHANAIETALRSVSTNER